MKPQPSTYAVLTAVLWFAPFVCAQGSQQAVTPEGTTSNSRQAAGPPPPLATIPPVSSGKTPEMLRQEHEALLADTEKLALLVNELKAQLAAANGMTLSVGSVKKADEIEKLSRSIKKRLKS